jgi:Arc/MetJ-type ribon-helix-helix transcriptional regulator
MNMYNEHEIDQTMQAWMQTKRFTADATTNAAIRERVEALLESGGYVSTSHFERAYLELLNEDAIQPFRGSLSELPAAAPAVPADVADFIERASASELRRRYYSDQTFRQQYDAYEKLKGSQKQQPSVLSLTAAEYFQLPAAQIVQNYRSDHPKGFRAAVDSLIARRLI